MSYSLNTLSWHDEEKDRYYDYFGNPLNVGDKCLHIRKFRELIYGEVKNFTFCGVTFLSNVNCGVDHVISLNSLGIKSDHCDYSNAGNDIIGNKIEVGDRVLFIYDGGYVDYKTGVVKKLSKVKITIDVEGYCVGKYSYLNEKKNLFRCYCDVLDLTKCGNNDLKVPQER